VVKTEWIRSEFNGILPRRWNSIPGEVEGVWNGQVTRLELGGFNDANTEEMDRYVCLVRLNVKNESDSIIDRFRSRHVPI
jgi:hypothetical protein